jgi:ATP-binding cassette subfamily C protein EexD
MKKPNSSELAGVIAGFKQAFIYIGLFSFVINLLMLVPSLYMLQVYDRVMTSRSIETLIMLTAIIVWLFLIMGLLEYVRSGLMIRLGSQLDAKLNRRLYGAMVDYALAKPGQGSAQAMSDLTNVRQFLTGNGLFAFFDSPWMPIYIAVLFILHPAFGWFSIGAAIVLVIVAVFNERSTKAPLAQANSFSIQSSQAVSAQLRSVEVLHAMGMLASLRERWLGKHLMFLERQSNASGKAAVWSNLSKSLRMLFQSLILGLGAYLAVKNEISPGMLIAGSIIMGRALAPIDLMIATWKQFGSARSSYHRLDELLAAFPDRQDPMSLPIPEGNLAVEGAYLLPPGSRLQALINVSFAVQAGEVLGVIGPSAAGKSSLARALMGVWPLAMGKVRLDGADLNHYNRSELGPHIGYLPQDVELLEGTIAENIARFGSADPEKVVEAAQLAGVHEMISRLPGGYNTPLGLGGVSLSGGQRQRIGLARAMYGSPRIVVLDEPNSNLDDAGEQALVKAVLNFKKMGTTVVLITHRPGILSIADKILLLVEGKVHSFGLRDDVLRSLQKQKNQPPAAVPRIAGVAGAAA